MHGGLCLRFSVLQQLLVRFVGVLQSPGEVPVEVSVARVLSAASSSERAGSFTGHLVTIRVECGHEEYFSVVDQGGDPLIATIVGDQVLSQVDEQLSSHNLIAVHVTNILEHWLHETPATNIAADLDVDQVLASHRSPDAVDSDQGRVLQLQVPQLTHHLLVRLVATHVNTINHTSSRLSLTRSQAQQCGEYQPMRDEYSAIRGQHVHSVTDQHQLITEMLFVHLCQLISSHHSSRALICYQQCHTLEYC